MAGKRKVMGRGLDALIKDGISEKRVSATIPPPSENGVQRVPAADIRPSPWQPRNTFAPEALSELVESIKTHGVLQPLLVRKTEEGYELIAGERRLRAAQAAMQETVPVILVEADDEKALEFALIENLQREDLNPIEEAEGYALLQKSFNMTQEDIARQVGKARASIANALRLLELSDTIRKYLSEGLLTVGHAKVLLSVEHHTEQALLAKRTIKEGLSVRALERIVKNLTRPTKKQRTEKVDLPSDYLHTLSDELQQYFGTSVRISPSKTLANGRKVKGSIEIDFHNNDELDRLLEVVGFSSEL